MLILFETSAGYVLFEGKKRITNLESVKKYYEGQEKAIEKLFSIISLQIVDFKPFKNTSDAFKCISKLMKGTMPKSLSKMLEKYLKDKQFKQLFVADKKLAKSISQAFEVNCQVGSQVDELFRIIRFELPNLFNCINDLSVGAEEDLRKMSLGIAHGLSRYKLKFSSQKVDTMVTQAICLLDDLDKQINNYMMRLRQWYGWHFPQLSKIITDNLVYTKVVQLIGIKDNAIQTDLSIVVPEDIQKDIKEASLVSMGTQINSQDQKYLLELCKQILNLHQYRETLTEYLKNRMQAIAPNLTVMVGEIVGARLISHAGSLMNLAKYPASTVQILGAQKALFKAIRTKHATPKYGIIYHAQTVSSAPAKIKGKVSRALAAKTALCIRCDALGEFQNAEMGQQCKEYIAKRISYLVNDEKVVQVRKPGSRKMGRQLESQGVNIRGDIKREGKSLGIGLPSKKVKQ